MGSLGSSGLSGITQRVVTLVLVLTTGTQRFLRVTERREADMTLVVFSGTAQQLVQSALCVRR